MQQPYKKFDSKAVSYELGRPSYPDAAIKFLLEKMKLDSSMTVADIGAGTGLLTKSLEKFFSKVIAIEPNDEMRAHIGSHAISGTAEATTLPNHSINAIFAAQAFHWFNIEKARAEFKRILKSPCCVTLLWNDRKTVGDAGLVQLENLMNSMRENSVQKLEADESALMNFFETKELNQAKFENPVHLNKESFCSMVLSRSYAPKKGTPKYMEVNLQLNELFDSYSVDSKFSLPYTTTVYWGRLSGRANV